MTGEGTGHASDPTQLIGTLFALIPVPVAIIDNDAQSSSPTLRSRTFFRA